MKKIVINVVKVMVTIPLVLFVLSMLFVLFVPGSPQSGGSLLAAIILGLFSTAGLSLIWTGKILPKGFFLEMGTYQ